MDNEYRAFHDMQELLRQLQRMPASKLFLTKKALLHFTEVLDSEIHRRLELSVAESI